MRKNNRYLKLLALLISASMIAAFIPTSPVMAQGTTVLAVSPTTSTALTCDETIITIWVQDVVALYGYDVSVSFTPGSIQVLEVTNGGFLESGSIMADQIDNTAGTIWFAMTQVAPSLPKTGSGDLIRIRLHALTPGATVNFTITDGSLSNINNQLIPFVVQNGSLTTSDVCPPAVLSINPVTSVACVGREDIVVAVRVRYAVDLYSYALRLSFNPGAVQVMGVVNAGFLTNGIYPPTNGYNNTTGIINFDMSQRNPALPKTGTGDLIRITLRAMTPNQTVNFAIDTGYSMIANRDGFAFPYSAIAGSVLTSPCDTTSVDLLSFTAYGARNAVVLNWTTSNEIDNLGFNLYRAASKNAKKIKLNQELIPTNTVPGSLEGASYVYTDTRWLGMFKTYYYWLETVDIYGQTHLYGPVSAKTNYKELR